MNHYHISQFCFDEQLRPENIIHLGSMCWDYSFPSVAKDAFEDDGEQIFELLEIPIPEDDDEFDELIANPDQIVELLQRHKKLGFLIEMATPVVHDVRDDGHSSYGWGGYWTKWFYQEDFEDCFDLALKWKEKLHEEVREREAKEKAIQ